MEFLMEKEQLKEKLAETAVIDCRFRLNDPEKGRQLYEEGHIPGAFYFSLDEQLTGPVQKHGGRHPLPDVEQLKEELERAGISNETTVVAYDDGGMQFASRFWWLLTYLGHKKVYLLAGGFKEWEDAGYPVTQDIPHAEKAHFEVQLQEDMLASYEDVKKIVGTDGEKPVLIDSRARERYLGETEPLDRIPGHIPGAVNKYWEEGVADGTFKNEEKQKERFSDLNPEEPVVVYCGSGVTATPNYLALKQAGFKNVKLYAGSYSDWVSYEENPVEKGETGESGKID